MASKPKPPKVCGQCGNEYPARQKAATCGKEPCVVAEITKKAINNVRKDGDCEVWLGFFRQKGHVPTICAAVYDEDGNRERKDFRVMQLRWPTPEQANGRVFENRCGNPDCVSLAHNILRLPKTKNDHSRILAKLPAQPLLDYVHRLEKANPELTLGPGRERIHRYEREGELSVTSADSFCIDVLGVHPTAVFGELFFEV